MQFGFANNITVPTNSFTKLSFELEARTLCFMTLLDLAVIKLL